MSSRVRSYCEALVDASRMAATTAAAPSAPSLPVIANGDSLARWQHLVGQPPADAGDAGAGRGGTRAGACCGRRSAPPARRRSIVAASGPRRSSGGDVGHGVGRHAPHAGLALGALLGEQQRRAVVGEHEAGLAAARLGRLLGVDEQPAALHQVHDERHRLEAHQQVLAAAADLDQRLAVRRRPAAAPPSSAR